MAGFRCAVLLPLQPSLHVQDGRNNGFRPLVSGRFHELNPVLSRSSLNRGTSRRLQPVHRGNHSACPQCERILLFSLNIRPVRPIGDSATVHCQACSTAHDAAFLFVLAHCANVMSPATFRRARIWNTRSHSALMSDASMALSARALSSFSVAPIQ